VHDGVRPLAGAAMLSRLFDAAARCKAVIPVVPVVDSLRRMEGEGGELSVPVSREGMVRVQTPQIFDAGILKEAYRQPFMTSFTDDASVVEAFGVRVHAVLGENTNLKITTPDDLQVAAALLGQERAL
ncbi:MAG: 2-C-methyl-D-erythritol 4-phosphate cytidylyltransferase, partial [Bacteroidales bacterium]|nr:2-C-methyl-D-erythritol 4-phosphate cytidylyltransferase [Bacteroidales bacterium]